MGKMKDRLIRAEDGLRFSDIRYLASTFREWARVRESEARSIDEARARTSGDLSSIINRTLLEHEARAYRRCADELTSLIDDLHQSS